MRVIRYLVLGIAFVALFTIAVLVLEILEGNKITTTEYYGLRNIGFTFIMMDVLFAVFIYPILVLPVSMVFLKFVSLLPVRFILYILLGGVSGIWIFYSLYNDRFIQEYHLNISSAVIVFAIAGLIYAALDHCLDRQVGADKLVFPQSKLL